MCVKGNYDTNQGFEEYPDSPYKVYVKQDSRGCLSYKWLTRFAELS
jgi:hypothetical protein